MFAEMMNADLGLDFLFNLPRLLQFHSMERMGEGVRKIRPLPVHPTR